MAMTPLARRVAFTLAITLLAAAAASAGVLAWRAMHPPRVELAVTPAPPPTARPVAQGALAVGDPRPAFALPDVDGNVRSVSEWDGKLLFVNFWATWCPPCLEEIPSFVKLQERFAAQGVQFLGIALDSPDNVSAFWLEHDVNYPSLHGQADAIELSSRYGNRIGALPYTVVVGRDGRVLHMHQGILSEADALAIIQKHL